MQLIDELTTRLDATKTELANVEQQLTALQDRRRALIDVSAALRGAIAGAKRGVAGEPRRRRRDRRTLDEIEQVLRAAAGARFSRHDAARILDVGEATAVRRLALLVQAGRLQVHGRRPQAYTWVRTLADAQRVWDEQANGTDTPTVEPVHRGVPISGTGRPQRALDKDMHQLIQPCLDAGWQLKQNGGNHVELSHPDESRKLTLPLTPSDHRSLANARALLKREGLPV